MNGIGAGSPSLITLVVLKGEAAAAAAADTKVRDGRDGRGGVWGRCLGQLTHSRWVGAWLGPRLGN